jgi:hypothetical protein
MAQSQSHPFPLLVTKALATIRARLKTDRANLAYLNACGFNKSVYKNEEK